MLGQEVQGNRLALSQHPWTLQVLPVTLGIPALARGWDVFSLGLVTYMWHEKRIRKGRSSWQ